MAGTLKAYLLSRTDLESGKVQDTDDLPESDFMKAFKVIQLLPSLVYIVAVLSTQLYASLAARGGLHTPSKGLASQ